MTSDVAAASEAPVWEGKRASFRWWAVPIIFMVVTAVPDLIAYIGRARHERLTLWTRLAILFVGNALFAWMVSYQWLAARNARLVVYRDTLRYTRPLGQTQVIDRDQIREIRVRRVDVGRQLLSRAYVIDHAGGILLTLKSARAKTLVADMAAALSVPLIGEDDPPVKPRQLQEELPGSLGFAQLHNGWTSIIVVVVLITLFTVLQLLPSP